MGVPPSVLWSWPREDVALLHAARAIDAETSPNGYKWADEVSPEADPSKRGGSFRFAVAGGLPVTNYAEKARLDAADAYKEANPKANMNGLVWHVEKVPR